MNWHELKSQCVDQVAREIARPRVIAADVPRDQQSTVWARMQKEAEPEAVDEIQAMTNMELLDLISEVVGRET